MFASSFHCFSSPNSSVPRDCGNVGHVPQEIVMISVFSRPSRLALFVAAPLLLAAKPLAAPLAGGTTYEFIVHSQSDRAGNHTNSP